MVNDRVLGPFQARSQHFPPETAGLLFANVLGFRNNRRTSVPKNLAFVVLRPVYTLDNLSHESRSQKQHLWPTVSKAAVDRTMRRLQLPRMIGTAPTPAENRHRLSRLYPIGILRCVRCTMTTSFQAPHVRGSVVKRSCAVPFRLPLLCALTGILSCRFCLLVQPRTLTQVVTIMSRRCPCAPHLASIPACFIVKHRRERVWLPYGSRPR